MLVHELYKALMQSNQTVRKLKNPKLSDLDFVKLRTGDQSLETNSSAIEVPIISDVKSPSNHLFHPE